MLKTKEHTGETWILGWPVDGKQIRESLSGQEINKLLHRILVEATHKSGAIGGWRGITLGIKRAQERRAANIHVRM